MSRARKLCEEINAVVEEYGHAYLVYNGTSGISTTPELLECDSIIMVIRDEMSEEVLLDNILMRWESEISTSPYNAPPNYLWALRNRLWDDYYAD